MQVWHSVLSQSVHLDSESTTDTPTHHHNEQSSTTKDPMYNVWCESSRSSQAVYGWSRKEGWPQSTDEMHSLYALTTAQCCNREGYEVISYSITNGNQCDVVAHTRGKAGDVIAAPRHIHSLPLATGRAPQNVDCKVN